MNITTKSEYGLRALIYLATEPHREAIPAREISEKWHVPVKYLEQILKTLKDARIIESHLGVGADTVSRDPRLSLRPAKWSASWMVNWPRLVA